MRALSRSLLLFVLIMSRVVAAPAATDGFVKTSDGIRIHYVEAGQGVPIVLIPGWRMPGWIWQKQIDGLSGKYRVIAVDPRSQGRSDKPRDGALPETRARDYKQLVDQLGLKQPVLVGWSMGCGELLSYVEQFGESNIRGLVLVDGLIPAAQNPTVVSLMEQWTKQLQQDRRKEADQFAHAMFKKPQPEGFIQRVAHATLDTPTDSAVALIYNMISVSDFSSAFARIDRPLLFAYEPVLQANADYLQNTLGSRIQLERFDDAGHALFVDDPVRFNALIDTFVQGLSR